MRYLATITILIPLLLGGCVSTDDVKSGAIQDPGAALNALFLIPAIPFIIYDVATRPEPVGISDEELCKNYWHEHPEVAKELAERKLDCSKLNDSTSSK